MAPVQTAFLARLEGNARAESAAEVSLYISLLGARLAVSEFMAQQSHNIDHSLSTHQLYPRGVSRQSCQKHPVDSLIYKPI